MDYPRRNGYRMPLMLPRWKTRPPRPGPGRFAWPRTAAPVKSKKRLLRDRGGRCWIGGSGLERQQLLSEDRNVSRGFYPQPNLPAIDVHNGDANIFTDADFFTKLSAEDQHVATLLRASLWFYLPAELYDTNAAEGVKPLPDSMRRAGARLCTSGTKLNVRKSGCESSRTNSVFSLSCARAAMPSENAQLNSAW